jgi:hypothetical protein
MLAGPQEELQGINTLSSTAQAPHGVVKPLFTLLWDAIDYAGLFPPAALGMATVVGNYARYRADSHNSWALGRLIIPLARLNEFEQYFEGDRGRWSISALTGTNLQDAFRHVADFNLRHAHKARIDSIETKIDRPEDLNALPPIPDGLTVFLENTSEPTADFFASLRKIHARAKIRTGGLSSDAFPSSSALTRFLLSCAQHQVAFKATAGLHHPVRCVKPLTYEPDSPTGTMHGFLNLLLAAVLARQGKPEQEIQTLLDDQDASHFSFDETAAHWNQHSIPVHDIESARGNFVMSFGSCSFEEPIADLKALNLL